MKTKEEDDDENNNVKVCQEYIDHFRKKLDYSYHENYDRYREQMQDDMLRKLIQKNNIIFPDHSIIKPNWLIMTAGPMGSGKSTLIKELIQSEYFQLDSPVRIDMDELRDLLPQSYALRANDPQKYVELTQIESGTLSELFLQIALSCQRNVILDSSMMNLDWQKGYLQSLKRDYPLLVICILHVSAEPSLIRRRVSSRNQGTSRFTPQKKVEESIRRLNDWKNFLSFENFVDFFLSVENSNYNISSKHQLPRIQYPWHFTW
jgi:dephospho-CoA kinase